MQWIIAATRIAAALAIAGTPALPSIAAAAAAQPPQALLDAVGRLDRACEAAGGRPARGAFLIAQDFSGDGVSDYLVNEGNYECSGRPDLFIDDKQAHVDIYVADHNGDATLAYRERLLAVRVLDGRPHVVQVAQHGSGCGAGSNAATECGGTLRWNAQEHAFDLELTGVRANPRAPLQRPANARVVARAGQPSVASDGARVKSTTATSGGRMKRFPANLFRSGYYVDAATPCAQASNATVTLIGRAWFSGGIDWIKQMGPKLFEVHASGFFHGDEIEVDQIVRFDDATHISFPNPDSPGNESKIRYCPQQQMPNFRDNDISHIDG
jgi:hypothetical protein